QLHQVKAWQLAARQAERRDDLFRVTVRGLTRRQFAKDAMDVSIGNRGRRNQVFFCETEIAVRMIGRNSPLIGPEELYGLPGHVALHERIEQQAGSRPSRNGECR